MSDTEQPLKIMCIYCNAPWDAVMLTEYVSSSGGCDTCGYGAGVTYELVIKCSNCERVVYKKEHSNRD